ncbi:hypothetical protein ACEN88_35050, partial [Massilia sp. CT11-108]|uniref:hypothetical protein n=1 Tax=Massilia sp. CT11-108 TaxID=3393900 RepID=UPI0039A553A9
AGAGDPLDLRARFSHPPFGAKPSDARRWKGQVYADLRNTDLAAWKQYVDYPFTLQEGRGSVRAWLDFDHARLAGGLQVGVLNRVDVNASSFSGGVGTHTPRAQT